jgi:hypothetical protein
MEINNLKKGRIYLIHTPDYIRELTGKQCIYLRKGNKGFKGFAVVRIGNDITAFVRPKDLYELPED